MADRDLVSQDGVKAASDLYGGPDGRPATADRLDKTQDLALIGGADLEACSAKEDGFAVAPPPDGGAAAWLQTLYGHLLCVCTWGIINSNASLTPYYAKTLDRSVADVNWIASIQICLLFLVGSIAGRLTDAGYARPVLLLGSTLVVLGLFTASVSHTYWQLLLAQGVTCGLGNGLLFCTALTIVSAYWSTKRSLAMGLVACGSGVGGLIFPAIVKELLPSLGFGWTMRIIAFLVAAMLTVCNLGMRPRLPPRRTGPFMEWAAFTELPFSLFTVGMFLNFTGLYYVFFDLALLGQHVVGASREQQVVAVLIINGMGLHARIIPNYLADRYTGPLNLLIPVSAATGIILLAFNGIRTYAGYLAAVAFYGMFGAALQSLFPATLVSLTDNRSKSGTRMGMCFTCVSIATLIGSPVAGVIISAQKGNFTGANIFGGVCLLGGSLALLGSRIAKVGWKMARM